MLCFTILTQKLFFLAWIIKLTEVMLKLNLNDALAAVTGSKIHPSRRFHTFKGQFINVFLILALV